MNVYKLLVSLIVLFNVLYYLSSARYRAIQLFIPGKSVVNKVLNRREIFQNIANFLLFVLIVMVFQPTGVDKERFVIDTTYNQRLIMFVLGIFGILHNVVSIFSPIKKE